jgi:hypothetical protein
MEKETSYIDRSHKALKIIGIRESCSFLIGAFCIFGFLFILGFVLMVINNHTRGGLEIFYGGKIILFLIIFPLFIIRYIVPILGLNAILSILSNWECISNSGIEILGEKQIKAIALRLFIIAIIFAGIPIFHYYFLLSIDGFWGYMIIPVSLIAAILGMGAGCVAFILYSKTSAKLFGCIFSVVSFLSAFTMAAFIIRLIIIHLK